MIGGELARADGKVCECALDILAFIDTRRARCAALRGCSPLGWNGTPAQVKQVSAGEVRRHDIPRLTRHELATLAPLMM